LESSPAIVPKQIELNNPQMDVLETTAQRVLMHCGVGIGKSHCIGLISAEFCINNPEVRGFIGANTYGQLTKSTLDRVFKVWEECFGWVKGVHYVVDHIPPESFKKYGPALKSYENTISFNNGALIFLASLDNYKVIDGTEFAWALLDETKDTKEEAVKEVITARLRQIGMWISPSGVISKVEKPGYNGYTPLYIFTSPAKVRWIMEWFKLDEDAEEIEKCIYDKTDYYRKRKGDHLVVIASSYHNEHNLAKGYLERLINDLGGNSSRLNMLIYGSPFGKTGGEYYSGYVRLKHIKEFEPWAEEPIHLSFDFNWVPYMTCTAWQMRFNEETGRYLVRAIGEFTLSNPDNNTPALCKAVIKKYGEEGYNLLKNGLYYYGDYNGKAGRTISEEFKNEYEVVEHHFKRWLNNTSDRVIVNPLHKPRRDFINKLLTGGFPIDIEINVSCKELRGDFEFVKEDANGKKLKTKITVNGVSFEEHGHTSDTVDYFFCSAFNNLYIANRN
jgi:hypothetical protein